jgi:hypothetical protein
MNPSEKAMPAGVAFFLFAGIRPSANRQALSQRATVAGVYPQMNRQKAGSSPSSDSGSLGQKRALPHRAALPTVSPLRSGPITLN